MQYKQKFNENSKQSQTKITDFHESSKLSQERYHEITRACVKAFIICGIPWHVIENPFFIELLKTLHPGYMPPSRDNLSGELFAQEAVVVNQQIIKELKNSTSLTLLYDRWTNMNLLKKSHTGVFLAKEIEDIIKQIGLEKFSAVVSDAGANIQNARKIISEKYPNILSVHCIAHSINLISKDICNTPFANKILTRCNTIVTFFKRSHQEGAALKKEFKNYNLQADYTNILSQAVLTILKFRAFFDDVCALAFALHPIKKAILKLESQSCILADCFIGLVQLGAAIKKLLENNYFTFHYQCIIIFNKHYVEFANLLYLLCFFLHPEICWTRGTFQNLLITADEIFEKIGKSKSARKELMYQMKKYHTRQVLFDIELGDTEFPTIWWLSIKNNFSKRKDYLVQLALKLFSITPHAAGCKRV
ncbi:hypothetical protein RclHR1_11850007 [Rhizophagus clarus]|uniref:DUF659 domain-containing protein n=1 Tax=Rhizophagus clarus TaxID=94130 RepID=A0A2Z6Q9T9_9GLOM|nr:hypothetical protein RclHR1_11850007 [Rhizophagus clarus]